MAIRIEIIDDRCKGCGVCVELCQFEVLAMHDDPGPGGKHIPHVIDLSNCVACGMCEMYCPDNAITVIRKTEEIKIG